MLAVMESCFHGLLAQLIDGKDNVSTTTAFLPAFPCFFFFPRCNRANLQSGNSSFHPSEGIYLPLQQNGATGGSDCSSLLLV